MALNGGTGKSDESAPVMVDVGAYALHAQVRGNGPTVVLECGGAGQGVGGAWGEHLESALAEHATVVTYDRAGVGRSGGTQAHTVSEMADDLHRLLRGLRVELPAVFVGWSFGGLVVQMYAARHSADVAGLVLVDPTVTGTPPGLPFARSLSFRLVSWLLRRRASLGGKNARSLRELAGTVSDLPQAMRDTAEARREIGLPPVPIRVITPGRRPRMPRAHAHYLAADHRDLVERSPYGRLMVADRASHQIPLEQPEIIVQAVTEVLGSRPPAPH